MSEPTWTMTPCGKAYSQCPREAEARQGRALEDMEQARRCQQLGADYTALAETRMVDAQRALIALTAYPYGRETREVAA